MIIKKFFFSFSIIFFYSTLLFGQNNSRIVTKDYIGWHNVFATFKFKNKFGFHAEYQWRRIDFVNAWQQSLLRTGINYNLKPNIQFRLGYAWIETFPYGDIPINVMGKNFTEHRIFQMIQLNQNEGRLNISHRFMLEQRFVGRYSNIDLSKEDVFIFTNRARYLLRVQMPLKGTSIQPKIPYVAIYNELFIGFGKNVQENVFDQNRIGVLAGYVFNPSFRFEVGYLNQIIQLGREVNGKNVFQHNNGFLVNAIINLNLIKAEN